MSGRSSRKHLLLGMMVLFTIGNVAAAAAPDFGFLLAARVVTGLPHGAFFGVGSAVAAGLVDEKRSAQAISMMFTGLTVANIIGVPAAAAVGNAFTWRLTFLLIAAVGVFAAGGIALMIPAGPAHAPIRLRAELHAFASPQVWLALAVGTFGFGGVFAVYSYIAPTLAALAGVGTVGLTVALALFGLGMTAGNLLGGRLADRALMPAIYLALGTPAAVLALFTLTAHNAGSALATVFAIGAAAGAALGAPSSTPNSATAP